MLTENPSFKNCTLPLEECTPWESWKCQEKEDNCKASANIHNFEPLCQSSRSASDKYTGIIKKTGSENASAFQRSIHSTLFSGEFSKSLTSEQEALGAYFASGFIDQWV